MTALLRNQNLLEYPEQSGLYAGDRPSGGKVWLAGFLGSICRFVSMARPVFDQAALLDLARTIIDHELKISACYSTLVIAFIGFRYRLAFGQVKAF